MKFSSMLLYVNDELATKNIFDRLLHSGQHLYRKGKYLYSIEEKFIRDNYFWMYMQYENEILYSNKVVDTEDNSEKENPRPKNQIELRNQLFACYDLNKKLLYISDYTKKSMITEYISDMLQVTATTKNILKSIDDFVSIYKRLKSVTFTQCRSLFTTSKNSIFSQQANLYGYDLPEHCKLKVDYGLTPAGLAKTTLQNWKSKHDTGEFDEVVVIGVDDSGFESSFNFSTMISSIEIDLEKNEDDRYDPERVNSILLAKLGV